MASVRKLKKADPESPWIVEYTDPRTGKRKRATPKSGLKKDAQKLREKIEREIGDGIHTPASETRTVAEAVEGWLNECEHRRKIRDGMAGLTIRTYRTSARTRILPYFGARKLTDITARMIQDHLSAISAELQWRTVAGVKIAFKQALDYAVRQGWLKINPMDQTTVRIPGKSRAQRDIPNREEIRAILAASVVRDPRERWQGNAIRAVMVTLAVFAGLRTGEIFGLQWENVDFDTRTLHVRHSLSKVDGLKAPKSHAGLRSVPMSEPVYAILKQVADQAGEDQSGFVLLNPWGGPVRPDKGPYYWKAVMQRANLLGDDGKVKYSFHTLRHAAVSLMIAQGLDALRIKGIVGHASVSVTLDIYGHMFPDDESGRKAIDSIGGAFGSLEDSFALFKPDAKRLSLASGRDKNATLAANPLI